MEVETLKLELERTQGMLYAIARQEATKANITVSLSAYPVIKTTVELNIRYAIVAPGSTLKG